MWSQADGGQQAPGAHPGPPKGGGGGGPNGQGLVHWMSVMAEHMNSAGGSDGVHYMWNGAVEVSTTTVIRVKNYRTENSAV